MIVEDGGSVEAEEIDGGVNGAGFQGVSDLADDEPGVVGGGRWRESGGGRGGGGGGVFDEVFRFGEIDDDGVQRFPIHRRG